MPNKGRPTRQKRDKERARQQKQRDKALHRLEAKQQKAQAGPRSEGGEDPDIAGIRPGPQPLPAQWALVQENEEPSGDNAQ
ncbi:MAG: hypothetical protein AB7P69_02195 [Candidatus Binatia bacterium]